MDENDWRCIICHQLLPPRRWYERGLLGLVFSPPPVHDPRAAPNCWGSGTAPVAAVAPVIR